MEPTPYDRLYEEAVDHILWGDQPGRLMSNLTNLVPKGRVLDAGCGDGKNALYLEIHGYDVVGVDSSSLALTGLQHRFNRCNRIPQGQYLLGDVGHLNNAALGEFDALISYGLYHCLPEESRIGIHRCMQDMVVPEGLLVFTCLNDRFPMPPGHGTSQLTLMKTLELDALLAGWEIIEQKEGIILEDHLPTAGKHQHSAVWLIARKRSPL